MQMINGIVASTPTRDQIFAALGRVAVYFSTLEAHLENGLCELANEENPIIAATVLERAPFSRKIDMLEKLAKFKNRSFQIRFGRLAKTLRRLGKTRNRFIHGSWDLSPQLLAKGRLAVTDSRVVYDESECSGGELKSWSKGEYHELSYHQLRNFETEVMRALKMVREILPSAPPFYATAHGQVQVPPAHASR